MKMIDSIPIGVETILIYSFIIYCFYEQFKQTQSDFIYKDPFFWFAFGIMIYLGGSFFFYILADHINEDKLVEYSRLTYIADIVKNALFLYALILLSTKGRPSGYNSVPNLDMI
jgi:hypothetical protein